MARRFHDDHPARPGEPRALAGSGVVLCLAPGATGLTEQDLVTAQWFLDWCKAPGDVPFPGCGQCERTTSLDLEPGQVASCGQHAYARKGAPRDPSPGR